MESASLLQLVEHWADAVGEEHHFTVQEKRIRNATTVMPEIRELIGETKWQ